MIEVSVSAGASFVDDISAQDAIGWIRVVVAGQEVLTLKLSAAQVVELNFVVGRVLKRLADAEVSG